MLTEESRLQHLAPAVLARPFEVPRSVAGPAGSYHQARVLIVDHDMNVCTGLKLMMLELGYRSTRTARYAIRALGLVGAFAPHIALLELDLPDMNVYRLAQVMRTSAHAHQCRLRLIAVANGEPHASGVLARAAGFDGYLAKPIRSSELNHVLQSLRR